MSTNATIYVSDITMTARAPGKIILSGEHAVVYGTDAVAVAVQEYTTVSFSPVSQSKVINTLFSGISGSVKYPLYALGRLKHRLDERFEMYTRGDLPVQNILNHPNDLVMYSLMALLHQLPSRQTLKQLSPNSGTLSSESTIPMGAGMGSSASAIAATLVLYEDILERSLTKEQLFDMIRFCERLQHGCGSAIDAAAVTFGGAVKVNNGDYKKVALSLDKHWYWLHTGTPTTNTGECVQQVKKDFADEAKLWDEFQAVTKAFVHALLNGNDFSDAVRKNHELLTHIGVVPDKAQAVIADIERKGAIAKISGAGAVAGDKAGLILVNTPSIPIQNLVNELNSKHPNYIRQFGKIQMDVEGAKLL